MKRTPLNRRSFLRGTAGFGAALALPNSKVLGANDEIRVAVMGVHSRGNAHIKGLGKQKGVRIAALCDVDPRVLDGRAYSVSKDLGYEVEGAADIRTLLDRDDIDVITCATPNHWHSLSGVWAAQAGKDSYIEKPISHNVWEGRQLVNAARKHNVICAGGTQSRSMESIQKAVKYVRDGELGKVQWVKGMCYKPRGPIGKGGGGDLPGGVDYDLWCGPAPIENPLRRKKFHYDWHWFYAYGNGDMGNQGIHQMDVARWFLGDPKIAPRTISIGGRLGYDDDGETPNTQLVYHDYDEAPLIFETRGLPKDKASQSGSWGKNMNKPDEFPGESGISVAVQCENGRVYCSAGGKAYATDNDGKEIVKFSGGGDHFVNFIKAVKSRKYADLNADCEVTHYSSALCHTGQISHMVGIGVHDGEVRERIAGDKVLADRYASMAEHLSQNEVNLNESTISLGPLLKFDPETEWFEGNGDLDAKANALATRQYREPYVVPEIS